MKKLISIAIITSILALFIIYARGLYMPLVHAIRGKETVASTIAKIQVDAMKRLQPHLDRLEIKELPDTLLLLGLKEEQILHVYHKHAERYHLLTSYPFTAYSGRLGPKLREGDRQIPEGIYAIDYLNPNSAYHLSIKLDYPNAFDTSKTNLLDTRDMGGDIFIHGKAETVGCIPIGDRAIEELFLMVNHAGKDNIKIIVSPRDFRVNPTEPTISDITWEKELYTMIKTELKDLPLD